MRSSNTEPLIRLNVESRGDVGLMQEKTKELPVNVVWDARKEDRRRASADVADDRRASDRRGKPPFTWDAGDFVVVEKKPRAKKR